MLEDLKELRKKLQKEKKEREIEKAQNYFVIYDFSPKNINNGEELTSDQILASENTEQFANECEELFKEAIMAFEKNNIEYNCIQIVSKIGYIIKGTELSELKNMLSSNENDFWKKLNNYVAAPYIPLKFSISMNDSGLKDNPNEFFKTEKSIKSAKKNDNYLANNPEFIQLENKNVKGIVNYYNFILEMHKRGYFVGIQDIGDKNVYLPITDSSGISYVSKNFPKAQLILIAPFIEKEKKSPHR